MPDTAPATTPEVPPSSPPATVPPVVEARVAAHRAVSDPQALTNVLDGAATPVVSRASVPVTLTTDGEETQFALDVSTVSDPDEVDVADRGVLALARAGVYPITVELVVDGTVVATSETFVDRLPATPAAGRPATQVAVVADVADPGPSPEPAEIAAGRADLQALAESADALGGAITVRMPPAIADAVETQDPALLATLREAFAGCRGARPAVADPRSVGSGRGRACRTPSRAPCAPARTRSVRRCRHPRRCGPAGWSTTRSAPRRRRCCATRWASICSSSTPTSTAACTGGIGGYHDWSQAFLVDLGDGATLPGMVVSPLSHWLDRTDLDRRQLSPTDGAVRLMAELVVRQALDPSLARSAILELPAGVAPDPEVASALTSYLGETPDFGLTHLSGVPAATAVMDVPGRGPESVRLPAVAGPDLTGRVSAASTWRG